MIIGRTTAAWRLGAPILLAVMVSACGNGLIDPRGSGWSLEPVAMGNELGYHSAVAVSDDGTVHLAYHDAYHLRLFYARRAAPGQWLSTPIDTVGWKGEAVTLEAGIGDTLHLAYKDIFPEDLRYARFDGESWQYERLDTFHSGGENPYLVATPDGFSVVEMNTERSLVNYWRGGLGNWERVGCVSFTSSRASFAFCRGPNNLEIAAFAKSSSWRSSSWQIEHRSALTPESNWTRNTLLSGLKSDDFYHRSLVMGYDANDRRHVLFRNGAGNLVDLALGRPVDSEVRKAFVQLRRDSEGKLWILYARDRALILATYNELSARWDKRTAITTLDPAGRWDFQVDGDGAVHVSVYSSAGRLWYGCWEDD